MEKTGSGTPSVGDSSPVNGGATAGAQAEPPGFFPCEAGEEDHPKDGGGDATALSPARLRQRRRWPRIVGWAVAGATYAAAIAGVIGLAWVQHLEATLPPVPDPAKVAVSTIVVDRNGKLLRPFTTADGRWRLPVTVKDVDPRFLKMLIGYEDRDFASHGGVDYRAMLRAAGQFVLAGGHVVSGGSTLTMQVARLLEGTSTKDAFDKLRQIVRARDLEAHLSKNQILDLYLQLAPYGGNIEGVRAASLAYFGKEPTRLTMAEAALLVALPQSPEARRPDRGADAARNARDRVLDRLVAAGVVNADEASAAKSERVPVARRQFPLLAAHLGQEAIAEAPDQAVHKLTIDRDLQASLEALAGEHAASLGPKLSIAIVVADHSNGDILASVGSAGLFEQDRNGHVDMTRALRSPGSTLKPLIYGLAFEQGLCTPESLIEDRPTGFGSYAPTNFDGFHRGTVTIREALTQSLNVPAIIALDAVGPSRLVARMKRAMITPVLPDQSAPGLAVGLGGVGITLRDLVQLYAAIAHGGAPVVLRDGIGAAPAPNAGEAAPVLSSQAAWYVSDILADTPPPINGSPGQIAYKTGTSYGYRDAWAVGYDGAHVIGVWVGRPDGTPVPGIAGITTAAPILFEAFDRIGAKRAPLKKRPPGTLVVSSTSQLPIPLRRFRHPNEQVVAPDSDPQISYPQDGVQVDLGIRDGEPTPLVIKVRNGAPPFTFYANGLPIGQEPFDRSEQWQPDGAGFVTLSVVDSTGKSDRVTVFVE